MDLWGIIAQGSTSFVSHHTAGTVLKGCVVYRNGNEVAFMVDQEEPEKCLRREAQVYQTLEPHPHILQFFGTVEVAPGKYSLCLEYAARGDLRTYIQETEEISFTFKLKWLQDIASALQWIHSQSVYHCDLSCRNILLDSAYEVKLGDFGGSTIGDQEPLAAAESRYQLPRRGRSWDQVPVLKEEIFALGSTVYEVSSWHPPYEVAEESEIRALYEAGHLPTLHNLMTGQIIDRCWQEQYNSAGDVQRDLETLGLNMRDSMT